MVNSNNQKDYLNYNSHYRPSLDDENFIPSQGVLPLYYYEYGRLRGLSKTQESKQIKELNLIEHDESNNSILNFSLFLLMMYPIIKLVKKII